MELQAVQSVDREEMFAEHIKERERRKRADEKAARKRKLQEFKDLLERSSGIKVCCLLNHCILGVLLVSSSMVEIAAGPVLALAWASISLINCLHVHHCQWCIKAMPNLRFNTVVGVIRATIPPSWCAQPDV